MIKMSIANCITGILSIGLLFSSGAWKAAANPPSAPAARQSLTGIAAISAGGTHACALTTGGGVKCWGRNLDGELGNGSTANSDVLLNVVGLSEGVSAIAAGGMHTCALTTGGGVKCWGNNEIGQLGNATTTDSSIPVNVVGLASGVSALSAGKLFTCALMDSGSVKCWGLNDYGQLGNGTTTSSTTPVDVSGLSGGVKAIAVGDEHACALLESGGVKCWGNNGNGQLGNSATLSSPEPVNVATLASGVDAISSGNHHTCALIAGNVKCWGGNWNGELGDGSTTNSSTPVNVSGLTFGVNAISVGDLHTCAHTAGGGIQCWGYNGYGQLGDGSTTNRSTPVDVNEMTAGASAVSAGNQFTCALTDNGGVKCWGANYLGQLGNGTSAAYYSPVEVAGFTSGAAAIAAGYFHTCAVIESEGIQCWGYNFHGELGDGTNDDRISPVAVSGISGGIADIAAGGNHTCALLDTGGVKCWGYNSDGQLGDGTLNNADSNIPLAVVGLSGGASAIAAGSYHTCALTDEGGVLCWGLNNHGQLGDGTSTSSSTPVPVTGLSTGVRAIFTGGYHTCSLMESGLVKCWGLNDSGQLGNGSTSDSYTPRDVVGLPNGVSAIAAGVYHTCALAEGGSVKCWGYNSFGQLGDGSTTNSHTPLDVVGLANDASGLVASFWHTCALTGEGGAKCWGYNNSGQLGNGSATNSHTPQAVKGLSSGANALAAGAYHTCALMEGGNVKCWGDNSLGELGDGSAFRSTPSAVVEGDHLSFIPLAIYGTLDRR